MDDATVEIEGWEDIERKMQALGPELAKTSLSDALPQAGDVLKEAIEARAPYGPHYMKHSHQTVYGILQEDIDSVTTLSYVDEEGTVTVGPDRTAYWAQFSEFGTVHESAEPFIRPAFDESAQRALDKFVEVMTRHVDRITEGQ